MSQKPSSLSSMGTKRKRRRRKATPTLPAKVLATSIYAGLAALVRLAERRVTKDPEVIRLVNEIKSMWKEASENFKKQKRKGILDFSYILTIEHNMRKNYLGILWQTTKPYGNTEEKRVYKWSEGTIGPLNQLLNYAGAQLRSIAMKYYSLPKVTYYQVRQFPDGSAKILHKSTVKKYPPKKGVKTYWIATYPGNAKNPLVRVRHSTLPEMDFADMIRAHVIELVRQCFIYNVPRKTSQRYIRLLIFRLQPFLDYVYTDGKIGRNFFWPEADQVLREIVLELRAIYGRRLGRTQRLSQQDDYSSSYSVDLFDILDQLQNAWKRDPSEEMKATILGFLKLMGFPKEDRSLTILKKTIPKLTEAIKVIAKLIGYRTKIVRKFREPLRVCLFHEDAQDLHSAIQQLAGREGNDWHRVLFGDMFHPSSLRQAIFRGDKFLDEPSDMLIAAEVPVNSIHGRGKADLIVFIRRSVAGEFIWTPFMVLDVKTKVAIKWSLLGKKPRTRKEDSRVPKFIVRKRTMTPTEWNSLVRCTPEKDELTQLENYELGIIDEYRGFVKQDQSRLTKLFKGIVFLDSDEDQETLFKLLPWLVKSIIDDMKKGLNSTDSRILYTPHLEGVSKKGQHKFGLVLLPSEGPQQLLDETKQRESIIEDDPFKDRVADDIFFTLYLTVPSAGSSGESAGWIARNWHLLHHLEDLRETSGSRRQVIWFDLAGELTEETLRHQRLRLLGGQRPKGAAKRKMESLQNLVDSIDFQDLSDELKEYLFEDSTTGISELQTRFKERLEQYSEDESIIIIDGWHIIKDITPSHLDELLGVLEDRLLRWLPKKNVEVIWLDRPVPIPILSATYQTYRVTPLPHDSPRRHLLDEVIWNLPSSPRNFGWKTPRREDIRLIAQDLPTQSEPRVVPFGVPHLRGWAKRFRAESKDERKVSEKEATEETEVYGLMFSSTSDYVEIGAESEQTILTDIYQLVPSLARIRTKEGQESVPQTDEPSPSGYSLKRKNLGKRSKSKGLWSRSSFSCVPEGPLRGRPGTYSPLEQITRGKVRRPPREISYISRTSRRPPVVRPSPEDKIDTDQIRHKEVLRVECVAEFLSDLIDPNRWITDEVFTTTLDIISQYKKGEISAKVALDTLPDKYKMLDKSLTLWRALWSERRVYGEHSNIPQSVRNFVSKKPELMKRYGNTIFLLLYGVLLEEPDELRRWIENADILWRAVSEWQWTHMGFSPIENRRNLAMHRFDIPALYSNLLWRARQLSTGPRRTGLFTSYRTGELLPIPDDDKLWMVFQETATSGRMIAGVLTDLRKHIALRGKFETTVNLGKLAEQADSVLRQDVKERMKVIFTRYEDMDLLWREPLEDDVEKNWKLIGNLKYTSPKEGRTYPIRGVTIRGVPATVIEKIDYPTEVEIPENLEERVDAVLQEIAEEDVTSVRVEVSVNEDTESYQIRLIDGREKVAELLEYESTEEVIGLLRSPLTRGEYYQSDEGVLYSWNPKVDILYTEIDVKSGHLSLSFLKPLIENDRFANGMYMLPKSAKELLETELSEEILMLAKPDLERYKKKWKKCWKVWFIMKRIGDELNNLSQEYMTIQDIGLFFECRQIIDTVTGNRHPTKIAIDSLSEVELPLGVRDSGRIKEYLFLKELLDEERELGRKIEL